MHQIAALESQLEALREARNLGVVEVEYSNPSRRIRYRSLEAMDRIIRDLEQQVAASPTSSVSRAPSIRRVQVRYCRGRRIPFCAW